MSAHRRFTDAQEKYMAAKYAAGQSTVKIAKQYKCSAKLVGDVLRRQGVELRPSTRSDDYSDYRRHLKAHLSYAAKAADSEVPGGTLNDYLVAGRRTGKTLTALGKMGGTVEWSDVESGSLPPSVRAAQPLRDNGHVGRLYYVDKNGMHAPVGVANEAEAREALRKFYAEHPQVPEWQKEARAMDGIYPGDETVFFRPFIATIFGRECEVRIRLSATSSEYMALAS